MKLGWVKKVGKAVGSKLILGAELVLAIRDAVKAVLKKEGK